MNSSKTKLNSYKNKLNSKRNWFFKSMLDTTIVYRTYSTAMKKYPQKQNHKFVQQMQEVAFDVRQSNIYMSP